MQKIPNGATIVVDDAACRVTVLDEQDASVGDLPPKVDHALGLTVRWGRRVRAVLDEHRLFYRLLQQALATDTHPRDAVLFGYYPLMEGVPP